MLDASPLTIIRGSLSGAEPEKVVSLDAAVAVIQNFLEALDAPEDLHAVSINFARAFADKRLAEWGVRR